MKMTVSISPTSMNARLPFLVTLGVDFDNGSHIMSSSVHATQKEAIDGAVKKAGLLIREVFE